MNPETVQINSHYGYTSIVYFDENLTKIEVVVMYVMHTPDRPKGIVGLSRCELHGHP